jgi:hypothetical protein
VSRIFFAAGLSGTKTSTRLVNKLRAITDIAAITTTFKVRCRRCFALVQRRLFAGWTSRKTSQEHLVNLSDFLGWYIQFDSFAPR